MNAMPNSLFMVTVRDLRTVADSLLSDEKTVTGLSIAALLSLREVRLCAQQIAQGAVFPSLARRLLEAAHQLGSTRPSPLQNVALAAHYVALYLLDPEPPSLCRHIFEARVALRNQRAVNGVVNDGPTVLPFPTTQMWEP